MAQRHDGFAGAVEFLFARVAVFTFGHAHHRNITDAQRVHDFAHRTHLPLSAVDQQQVRPCALGAFGVFFQKALETAGQHLFHHAKVIAGCEAIALDVEFTVLVFVKAIRPRDNHRADGMGALDVRVVVDLDPLGGFFHIKGLGHAFEQTGLRGGFGHFARKAFAGIAQGVLHQLGLFATLGDHDFDLAFGLFSERICHQIIIVEAM